MNLKTPGSMSKKQKLILLIAIIAALAVLIGGNRIFQNNKEKELKAQQVGSEKEYHYIDSNGKAQMMNLESKALKTVIDTSKFKLDGTYVEKLYGDVLKADLKGESYTSTSLPESKGASGTHMGYLDNGKLTYSDGTYKGRMGIDVSYHQGSIDWNKVKKAGIKFVYIRAGYRGYGSKGKLVVDEQFKKNMKGAKKAGLDVGVYFFSQAVSVDEAEEEARFVLKNLGKTKLDLPIVFDPENVGGVNARTDNVSGKQFTKNTLAFCKVIKNNGYDTAVYSNMAWEANRLDMEKIAAASIPVWYADYEPLPQSPYKYYCWQYSATGRVDGIEGDVDLDIDFVESSK